MTTPPSDAPANNAAGARSARSRRWWVIPSILLAVPLLALAGWGIYWLQAGRPYIVEPGEFYRSAEMPPDELVAFCGRHDIRTVVDLREHPPGETSGIDEARALDAAGLRYVPIPSTQVPSRRTVRRFLELLDESDARPLLVHCEHGVGRTGIFTAIYRMEVQGWSNDDAIREARVMSGFDGFEEGSPERKFLMRYVSRRGRPPAATTPGAATVPGEL
jgi:protein tyrosine phosphatase (PTP) superfamily phosphohydrolase (DUF442 family)